MSNFPPLEDRSLKKKSHCPPDVYNQRDQQKEDLMSEDFVRDGFKYIKPVRDEYDSCKKESRFIDIDSLWDFYHSVINRKYEHQNIQDSRKKHAPSFRDSVVPVIDINKGQVNDLFTELAGTTPLRNLARRIPYSKDKEEILNEVLSHRVLISRAMWLINMSIIHTSNLAENTKRKPRAPLDATSDWTGAIFRMLKRCLDQICDESSASADFTEDWDYLFSLLLALYDADMADHWEVLLWLVKQAESIWLSITSNNPPQSPIGALPIESKDEPHSLNLLNFFLVYLVKVGVRFTENELITRRLLYWCCNLLSFVVFGGNRLQMNSDQNDLHALLAEYAEACVCPLNHSVVISLSSLIICLVLSCPSACIWNDITIKTDHSYLEGSPLDVIPFSLIALPMPSGPEAAAIRDCLFDVEESVISRGKLVECRWNHQSIDGSTGEEINRLVSVIEILDMHDYQVTKDNSMEGLFSLIFHDEHHNMNTDALVNTLCEWAVSSYRVGVYRPVVVACLLELLTDTFQGDSAPYQLLQDTLIHFLDNFTVQLPAFSSDRAPAENEAMRNLVCLFSELIDREVFDHDSYVRRMIARGVFCSNYHPLSIEPSSSASSLTLPASINIATGGLRNAQAPGFLSNLPSNAPAQHSIASEMSEDLDHGSVDNPDSVRSDTGFATVSLSHFSSNATSISVPSNIPPLASSTGRSTHFHYLSQFPLPQDESYTHEENQRCQLLYGSLRSRDRAKGRIRQLSRDICKLFTRKIYLFDVVHGEMCRRKRVKERDREKDINMAPTSVSHTSTSNQVAANLPNSGPHKSSHDETHSVEKLHDDIKSRFSNLSYHDMECVISQCMHTFIKMLSGCNNLTGSGATSDESHLMSVGDPSSPATSSNKPFNSGPSVAPIYMPLPNSLFLFFELIETSLNITCLISTIVDTLDRIKSLFESRTQFMALYMSFLCLRSVGILQRYQPVLFVMGDLVGRLVPTLISQVRQVKDPTQCGQFERCILAYLNDLFTSSHVIKTQFSHLTKGLHKLSALLRPVVPVEGLSHFDPEYASDLFRISASDNVSLFRAYTDDLRNNADSRFSFVCRAVILVCRATSDERINYLCGLCAELTSQCGDLRGEWLGSLFAVLVPRPCTPHRYTPIINAIDPVDMNIYDNLSSLIGILLSRHCFTICNFLYSVIGSVMIQGLGQPVSSSLEPSIRFACHILYRLFTAESSMNSLQSTSNVLTPGHDVSADPTTDPTVSIPQFRISEPFLLTGALQKVRPEPLVDVLKMLLVHSDNCQLEDASIAIGSEGNMDDQADSVDPPGEEENDDTFDDNDDSDVDSDTGTEPLDSDSCRRKRVKHSNRLGASSRKQKFRRTESKRSTAILVSGRQIHVFVQRFLEQGILPTLSELRGLSLSGLIQLVLRVICVTSWVRERFSRMLPKELIRDKVLLDDQFSASQTRRLLHIILFPFDTTWTDVSYLPSAMCGVLGSLGLWTMRCAQMKFYLLHAQMQSQQQDMLNHVAQSIVRGFQTQASNWLGSGLPNDGSVGPIGALSNFEIEENDPVWLLPALMSKLPPSMKTQIVKATIETLKGIRNFWKHKNDEDKEGVLIQNSIILSHPAFFSLLQICLLETHPTESLFEQIEYFVQNARETEDRVPDSLRTRQVVQECLRLRLTLVGQCFHTIQTDQEAPGRWGILLTQLISHGVVEPESNNYLFYMIYDMLQSLVHALASRSDLEGKHYQNFVKRVRRELAERPPSYGIEQIRPLLPPLKNAYTVVVIGRTSQRLGGSGSMNGPSSGAAGLGNNKSSGANKASTLKSSGNAINLSDGGGSHHASWSRNEKNKRGFIICGRERMAPWDVQDPSKQSMLLALHGAAQVESVPSRIEVQANRLIRHNHFTRLHRDPEFYMQPVYAECEDDKNVDTTRPAVDISTMVITTIKSETLCPNEESTTMLPPMASSIQLPRHPSTVPIKNSDGVMTVKHPSLVSLTDSGILHHPDHHVVDHRSSTLPCNGTNPSLPTNVSSEVNQTPSYRTDSNQVMVQSYDMIQPEYVRISESSQTRGSMRCPSASFTRADSHDVHAIASTAMTIPHHPGNPLMNSDTFHIHEQPTPKRRMNSQQPRTYTEQSSMISGGKSSRGSDSVSGSGSSKRGRRGGGNRRTSSTMITEPQFGLASSSFVNSRGASGTHTRMSVLEYPGTSMVGSGDMLMTNEPMPIISDPSAQSSTMTRSTPYDKLNSETSQGRASSASLRGFIRNRAQQQQQQRSAVAAMHAQQQQQQQKAQHQQVMYSPYNTNAIITQSNLRSSDHGIASYGTVTHIGRPSDLNSYPSTIHGVHGFNRGDTLTVSTQSGPMTNPHMNDPSVGRAVGAQSVMHRYMPQFPSHRGTEMTPMSNNMGVSQQIVPNPPPYPIGAQSNDSSVMNHLTHPSYNPVRSVDEGYMVVVDKQDDLDMGRIQGGGPQPSVVSMGPHLIHRQQVYQSVPHSSQMHLHSTQSGMVSEPVTTQFVYQQQHGGPYQRTVMHVAAPQHQLTSQQLQHQTQQSSQQYSGYQNY